MSNLGSDSIPFNDVARIVLQDALAARPRHGAHLKILMMNGLRQRGVDPYQFFAKFQKFSAFLATNADLVNIERRPDGADVLVSRRDRPVNSSGAGVSNARLAVSVWRAFTNPDAKRRRFIKRETGEVHHFTQPPTSPNDQVWADRIQGDPSYVEVAFADRSTQSAWMKDFLKTTPGLPDWMRRAAEHLTEIPYESSVETAFGSTLGTQFGAAWRLFRSEKVLEIVRGWAEKSSFPIDRLLLGGTSGAQPISPNAGGGTPMSQTPMGSNPSSGAALMLAALQECSPEELRSIQLPATLVVRLLSVR